MKLYGDTAELFALFETFPVDTLDMASRLGTWFVRETALRGIWTPPNAVTVEWYWEGAEWGWVPIAALDDGVAP